MITFKTDKMFAYFLYDSELHTMVKLKDRKGNLWPNQNSYGVEELSGREFYNIEKMVRGYARKKRGGLKIPTIPKFER